MKLSEEPVRETQDRRRTAVSIFFTSYSLISISRGFMNGSMPEVRSVVYTSIRYFHDFFSNIKYGSK